MQGARVWSLVRELDSTTKTWHSQINELIDFKKKKKNRKLSLSLLMSMLAVSIHTEEVLPSESEGIYLSFCICLKLSAMVPCLNKSK